MDLSATCVLFSCVWQEYSLTTEMAVNSGSTLLNTRTEFSYSVDPRKLIVVTTRIDDLSYGRDATNYSLAVGIVHPMTDVNIQMASHVGNSHALSSMATKVVYLTSAREKKTVEMRGHIDKLGKLMVVEVTMSRLSTGQLTADKQTDWLTGGRTDGRTNGSMQLC